MRQNPRRKKRATYYRTGRDGHTQPSKDEIEDKMEIYDEQQIVRRRTGDGRINKPQGRIWTWKLCTGVG